MNKLKHLLIVSLLFVGCGKSGDTHNSDYCYFTTMYGCKVLVCKEKSTFGELGYGFMSMIKDDCDCKFKEPIKAID